MFMTKQLKIYPSPNCIMATNILGFVNCFLCSVSPEQWTPKMHIKKISYDPTNNTDSLSLSHATNPNTSIIQNYYRILDTQESFQALPLPQLQIIFSIQKHIIKITNILRRAAKKMDENENASGATNLHLDS